MSSARWWVKKAARGGVAVGSWAGGARFLRRPLAPGRARARVLTYHRIADVPQDPFSVSPADFEAQVLWLKERGLAISLDDLRRFVAGQQELPDHACLITIDDGMLSTLTEALPILARHGVPAVAFVSAGLIGAVYDELPERYLSWDELRELAASEVVEVGSHAYTHRSLGLMGEDEARDEARRSRDTLMQELQREVQSFAYPFGTFTDFSSSTDRGLADAGYRICFNSMHGAIAEGMDPISLPRIKVEGGEGLWMFALLCRGAMDGWRVVDRNLWRLQRVRREIV